MKLRHLLLICLTAIVISTEKYCAPIIMHMCDLHAMQMLFDMKMGAHRTVDKFIL